MFPAYVIEVREEAVGLVVRDGRGFVFHAARRPYFALDGRRFGSPQQAERAATEIVTVREIAAGARSAGMKSERRSGGSSGGGGGRG